MQCGNLFLTPVAINNRATAVGGAASPGVGESWGLIYADGNCRTVQSPGGGMSFTSIDDDGDVTGIYSGSYPLKTFLYAGGKFEALPSYPGDHAPVA